LPSTADRRAEIRRRERVIAYGWVSPTVALSIDGQADRIRRHCESRGWEVASELWSRRFPELAELARRALESQVHRIVVAHEALEDLERRFPEAWGEIRARVEGRGAKIEIC
jgi:hypothetical protein